MQTFQKFINEAVLKKKNKKNNRNCNFHTPDKWLHKFIYPQKLVQLQNFFNAMILSRNHQCHVISLYIICDSADKYFTILPNDKIESISIDRIKPAYIDTKDMTISQLPTFSGDITSQTQQVTVKITPQNIAPCSTKILEKSFMD